MYQQINLYQPIFRKQRQIFSAVTLAQALGIVAVALLAFHAYGLYKVAGLETELLHLQEHENALTSQLASIDPSTSAHQRTEMDAELKKLNATLLQQQRLIDVLRSQPLGTTKGFSAYLAALGRQHTAELWLTALAINGGSGAIELGGRTLRPEAVPEFLRRLGTEPALAGQRFDRLQIERTAGESNVAFHATSRAAESDPDDQRQARDDR